MFDLNDKMTPSEKAAQRARDEAETDAAFHSFLDNPLVRMAGPQDERQILLLRAAFDAGFAFGGSKTALTFISSIMEHTGRKSK